MCRIVISVSVREACNARPAQSFPSRPCRIWGMPMEQFLRTVRFASIEIITGGNHGFRQRRSLVAHRHSAADYYLARAVLASLNSYEEQGPANERPFLFTPCSSRLLAV